MTGWTRDVLGRQPAPIVAALFHRITVVKLAPALHEVERRLRVARDVDITAIPTDKRAEVRHEQETLPELAASLRAFLGLDDG